ncbi:TPA: tRNA-dihydrouridine synthase family protein [Candidatus Woesearchaeota archaeon]|nr:tRNA-dihydrouridine synthase family protein [Candidatus Woesearchaeota archaeon]HIH39442.1 tRNA-dihydrouridine synthase family protein [Candidatus Woesearchaeota archaeon]
MEFPKLKNRFVLAPMADVTNLPFRLLCREYGASLASTEQINAFAFTKSNKLNIEKAKTCEQDRPLVFQLSGADGIIMLKAAKKNKNYDILDINMGCPSKKIVKQGFGAALLNEKQKIKRMMKLLTKNLKVPVTVKMRSGFKKDEAVEIAKTLEKAGVSAITLHARTQYQKYSGSADWSTIKKMKEAVKIPIIGNGDVTSPEKAYEMLEKTGCDYVMIGRAAIKNPSIFKQCIDYGKYKIYDAPDEIKMLKRYVELCKEHECETNLKFIASSFLKGKNGAARARDKIARAKSDEEVVEIFNSFLNKA